MSAPARGIRSTGVGSWPGTDMGDAIKIAYAECPELPYLPELPDRGTPAGLVGRGSALLSGLSVDLQPSGWRLASASGREHRQARAWLRSDLDQWEEHGQGYAGDLKLSCAGPWTLAASLERPRGGLAIGDSGARRDVAQSLAEGLVELVSEVIARLHPENLVVQLDEPLLPDVLAGRVRTASGLDRYRAIQAPEVSAVYAQVRDRLTAAPGHVVPAVHSCAPEVPVALLHQAGIGQLYLDVALLDEARWEEIGECLERGLVLGAGAWQQDGSRTVPEVVDRVAIPLRRLGLRMVEASSSEGLHPDQVIVTPSCGLVGARPTDAVAALRTVREAAGRLLDRLAG